MSNMKRKLNFCKLSGSNCDNLDSIPIPLVRYEMVESNARGSSIDPPTSWNTTTVQQWLLAHVNDLCNTTMGLSDDIFNHGFDR